MEKKSYGCCARGVRGAASGEGVWWSPPLLRARPGAWWKRTRGKRQPAPVPVAFCTRGVGIVVSKKCVSEFEFLRTLGLKALNMSCCDNPGLTDAAFVHLRGLHTLLMSCCDQTSITDAAFAHLHGLHTLSIAGCRQSTITDAAFTHLRGIQVLDMWGCSQTTITGATFTHLRGVRVLRMGDNFPAAIAAARALGLPVSGW